MKTPTIYEIKAIHEQKARETGNGGYFFTRQTMKFFGDTMKNLGVYQVDGKIYVYRKKCPPHITKSTWEFNPKTGVLNCVSN